MLQRIEVPARSARAVVVHAGQYLRVTAHAGPQVGDLFVADEHDHNISFSSHVTCSHNGRSFRRAEWLYSRPPACAPLLKVVNDPHGIHWVHSRCTRDFYQRADLGDAHPNCHDNITGVLVDYGFDPKNVPLDTFNIFMTVNIDRNGHYDFAAPTVNLGEYVDFLAARDVVVALSACPDDGVMNAFEPKPLLLELHDG